MIDINRSNRQRAYTMAQTRPLIEEAIFHVLYSFPLVQELMGQGIRVGVDWTLLGPRAMRTLNREQRGVDRETDILSFPARLMKEGRPVQAIEAWESMTGGEGAPSLFLGDLVLAPAVVDSQARDLGHSFERELTFLVIHGLLHLLGYDHEEAEDEVRMEAMQNRLMADLTELPCGFVVITGRPNVGKSTLLNELSDRTLAITTNKPQTTRQAIRSVLTTDRYQIALLDTPGLHQPKNALGKAMMKATSSAVGQADVVAVMIDASWSPFVGHLERRIIEQARKDQKPVILIINKVDATAREKSLPLIKAYDDAFKLDAYIPLSALKGDGIDRLLEEIVALLPVRRRLFSAGDETDQTERMLSAELIRREVLLQTSHEIPYGVTVLIESFEDVQEDRGRLVLVDAVIYCDRQSHKQILIGKAGEKIKSIGMEARAAMEKLLDARVHLSLFVKVKSGWQNKTADLMDAGLLAKD